MSGDWGYERAGTVQLTDRHKIRGRQNKRGEEQVKRAQQGVRFNKTVYQ